MKNFKFGLLLFTATQITAPGQASALDNKTSRPNILLMISDDQGAVDLNCYGATDLYTPNLDQLAQRGTRFTQFYVGAPICSASRAAILTGRYPQRAQLSDNAYGEHGMPAEQYTLAELLGDNGYRTGLFGKWHLGDVIPLSPNNQGFDEFLGHKVGCIDNYSHFYYWNGPNRHDLWQNETEHFEDGTYFPDIIVREADRFMSENKDKPFFLCLTFNLPHYPLQATQKYRDMYAHIKDPNRQRYAAFVSTLDEKVGMVIDSLKKNQLDENTIIIFLSDQGHSTEERNFGGGGSAGIYRGHKFQLWEGALRMPCIISWPGNIPQGQVRDQVTSSMDLYPTLAAYCNTKLPDRIIDGSDIRAVIESPEASSPHHTLYWQYADKWAVREGNWKLVKDNKELFLSDMSKDVTETNNLAQDNPDIVKHLTELHEKWTVTVQEQ
ncbi:MAG: sulfatase-like hydrolase/transferase [Sedimentisphaerales bacterium]|nr:sulfatase-like hydrolase/transferase [Sedimentisphaerales bacterium]